MLKRYLESNSANLVEPDQMVFADIIRSGNEQGLISSDWRVWKNIEECLVQLAMLMTKLLQ